MKDKINFLIKLFLLYSRTLSIFSYILMCCYGSEIAEFVELRYIITICYNFGSYEDKQISLYSMG